MGNELGIKPPKMTRAEKKEARDNRTVEVTKSNPAAENPESTPEAEQDSVATPVQVIERPKKKHSKSIFARLTDDYRRPLDGMNLLRWRLTLANKTRQDVIDACNTIEKLLLTDGINVIVGNRKGASGKSQLVAALSTVQAWVLQNSVGVLDFNPNGGHIADRLGVTSEEVTLRSLLNDPSPLESHNAMSRKLGHHPDRGLHNVHVISWIKDGDATNGLTLEDIADEDTEVSTSDDLLAGLTEDRISILLALITLAFHGVGVDLGNGNLNKWSRAAVKSNPMKSVVLIPFNPHQEGSEKDAMKTLAQFKHLDGKVGDRCILVASGLKSRKAKELIARCARASGLPENRISVIPFDPVFLPLPVEDGQDEQPTRIVNPKAFKIRTLLAYLNLLIRVAEVSAEYRIKYADEAEPQPATDTTRDLSEPEVSPLDMVESSNQPLQLTTGDAVPAQEETVSPELATTSP